MVHQYKLLGYNIVLDVCSGSVHVVDDVAYDIISLFEDNGKEAVLSKIREKYVANPAVSESEIEECYNQIEELKNAGKLF